MNLFKVFVATALAMAVSHPIFAINIKTAPEQVTVYPSGASIQRAGEGDLPLGTQKVTFEGLPAGLREDSLRLKVAGPKGITVYNVSLRRVFSDVEQVKRRAALEEKIQMLTDENVDLADQMAAWKVEADILKALAEKGALRAGDGPAAKLVELPNSVRTVGQRLTTLLALGRKAERSQRSSEKKLAAFKAELAQVGTGETNTRVAEAEISLAEAGTCHFELNYFVDQAAWTPRYDLRLRADDKEPKLELDFLAQVTQQSGEDWGDVSMALSTARPTLDSQVPDPTDWWLDYQTIRPVMLKSMRMSRNNLDGSPSEAMMPASAAELSAAPVQANYAAAEIHDLGPATLFNIKRRTSIPTGNQGQRVSIAHSVHPVQLLLVAAPRLSPAAFLEATVLYGGEIPLLPGPAQLFRDGDLAGDVQLEATAPGEHFTLGFGPDERIKVSRKRRAQREGTTGLFSGKNRRSYDWDIKISNFHEGARDIEVREQLPRSRQEGIKVSALELVPKPLDEDPSKPGLQRWDLNLKKGEERILRLRYEVKWPEGQRISGLEYDRCGARVVEAAALAGGALIACRRIVQEGAIRQRELSPAAADAAAVATHGGRVAEQGAVRE